MGVNSHTVDSSVEWQLEDNKYIMPNFRYTHQGKADFYHNSFRYDPAASASVTTVLPKFISADYRLDMINGFTLGATYGHRGPDDGHLRVRVQLVRYEYGDATFDSMNVFIINLNYSKKF